jgi:hypothetical protein
MAVATSDEQSRSAAEHAAGGAGRRPQPRVRRPGLILLAAVTFALLATAALVSLGSTPNAVRGSASGTAGLHVALTATHRGAADCGGGPSGPTQCSPDPGVVSPPHHHGSPNDGVTRNGPSTVHVVFTQAGTERGDATAGPSVRVDDADTPGARLLSDPTEDTDTSVTTVDNKVQIFFGNISAARAHQFTSSL